MQSLIRSSQQILTGIAIGFFSCCAAAWPTEGRTVRGITN
jgi:hypothetical protein